MGLGRTPGFAAGGFDAAEIDPGSLGRVLGLDRAPEVKTIRRKLGRQATMETWVTDAGGDPVFMVAAQPSESLAGELRRLLPDLRAVAGEGRRVTVCFDRGGWSSALFADILDGHGAVILPVSEGPRKGETVELRQVTRRVPARHGAVRQIHALTSRPDLAAGEVCWRMSARWREENYFRYQHNFPGGASASSHGKASSAAWARHTTSAAGDVLAVVRIAAGYGASDDLPGQSRLNRYLCLRAIASASSFLDIFERPCTSRSAARS